MLRVLLFVVLLVPLGCAQLPDLEGGTAAQRAPYPDLLPFNAFFGAPTGPASDAVDLLAGTDARAAALRARAAILRSSDDMTTLRALLAR